MTYRVRVDPLAQREIDQFAVYLRAYDEEFAIEQIERLDRIVDEATRLSIMREVGAFEAKNKLGALLDAVERGEEVTITRRGKPVARLVRPAAIFDRTAAKAAAARIRKRRKGVTLEGLAIKDLIDEGRL